MATDDAREGQQAAGEPTEGQGVIAALFPAPPSQAALYTRDNIHQYSLVKEARDEDEASAAFDWDTAEPQERLQRQADILTRAADEEHGGQGEAESEGREECAQKVWTIPDWDMLQAMEPPRVDWIEQDGSYSCFGETWPVDEKLAGLREMGMRQFYPDDCTDRRAAMVTLLRTLLKAYLSLVDVLLEAPQEYLSSEKVPNTDQVVQTWRFVSQDKAKDINDLSINIMHLLNEMRPLQAKEELRDLVKRQLDRRRDETKLIRLQCQAMRAELARMRGA